MSRLRAFLRDRSGAAAAEFALILPIALLFLLGTIDVGRYVWRLNELEKAVQMGTRYAVATDVLSQSLRGETFIGTTCGSTTLVAGDPICKEALGTMSCTESGCTCTRNPCPESEDAGDPEAFGRIVGRMQVVAPFLGADDVAVEYSGSGLGFAGDPITEDGGTAVAPIVTVVATPSQGMRVLTALGLSLRLPTLSYSQTLEDGDGAVAY